MFLVTSKRLHLAGHTGTGYDLLLFSFIALTQLGFLLFYIRLCDPGLAQFFERSLPSVVCRSRFAC